MREAENSISRELVLLSLQAYRAFKLSKERLSLASASTLLKPAVHQLLSTLHKAPRLENSTSPKDQSELLGKTSTSKKHRSLVNVRITSENTSLLRDKGDAA